MLCFHNIEAGIFIEESNLTKENIQEITKFFDTLKEKSFEAIEDDIEKIEKFFKESLKHRNDREEIDKSIHKIFRKHLGHLFLLKEGVRDFSPSPKRKRTDPKTLFMQEWRATQNYLSNIQEVLQEHEQPKWVLRKDFPAIITDQFIHAYYYKYVSRDNTGKRNVEEYFQKNKNDPEAALAEAIQWWSALVEPPLHENLHINEWAPSNYEILGNLKERDLSLEEFSQVMAQNHAAKDYANKMSKEFLGLKPNDDGAAEDRINKFSEFIFNQKTKKKGNPFMR